MPFLTDLKIDFIEHTNDYILEEELKYYDKRSKQLFVVPIGFVSNGASIPKFLWPLLGHPFQKRVRKPALLHDFLYRNNVVEKKVADQMFYDALIEEGVSEMKAQIFYGGLQIVGYSAYRKEQ